MAKIICLLTILGILLCWNRPPYVVSTDSAVVDGPTDGSLIPLLMTHDVVVIHEGQGGNVSGMINTLKFLMANPEKRVVIDGNCFSACTLLMSGLPNVYVTPNARMFFHSASRSQCVEGQIVRTIGTQSNIAMFMLFPSGVQDWIIESEAFDSYEFTRMPTRLLYTEYWPKIVMGTIELSSITTYTRPKAIRSDRC